MARSFKQAMDKMEEQSNTAAKTNDGKRRLGYIEKREGKSTHISLVMRQSVIDALDELKVKRGLKSRNELANDIIEEYLNEHDE